MIKGNGVVCIDGRCFFGIDMIALPENLHAMQWYGDKGEEERFDLETRRPFSVEITNLDSYSGVLDQWEQKRAEEGTPTVEPPTPYVPSQITRRQCARQLLADGMISASEAIAMTQTGQPPAAVLATFDALPEPDRTYAIIDFAADIYMRDNPLLHALMLANNMTDDQVDRFFVAAEQL